MRVLRIIRSLNPKEGGPVESVSQSSAQMVKQGHRVTVLCFDQSTSAYLEGLRQQGVEIVPLGEAGKFWAYHSGLKKWLRANYQQFDSIIVHGLWLYQSFAVWSVSKELGFSYHLFSHGMLDPWFQSWRRRPFKTLRNYIYWKLIENRVVRDARTVFFTTKREMELAGETFRPYQCRGTVVAYGTANPPVYTSEFKKRFEGQCPALASKPYILFLSRIHPKKGVDLLINAFAKLWNEGILGETQLVIAGPGWESPYGLSLKEQIGNQWADQDCPVHPLGMLKGESKWGALYGCEAFILPSHQENFGIVVAEALACGKAVLITEEVNIYPEIRDAGVGLVSDDTAEGVEGLLRNWIKMNEEKKQKMSAGARPLFESNFHIEQATKTLLNSMEEAQFDGTQ